MYVTYIGKTYCHLSARIAEHKGISVRTGQTLINEPISSIRDHALHADHDINTNCFKIKHKPELNCINVSESTLIKKISPDLNNQSFSTKLNILGYIKKIIRHIVIDKKTLYYLFNNCIKQTPFNSGYILFHFMLILRSTDEYFRINRRLYTIKT